MTSVYKHQHNLIGIFAYHPVAANLLMVLMLISGFWALTKLNTQFFPNFALDIINVRVVWSGATAEDVELSLTNVIERELRTLDGVRKMTSTSASGVASITLEYEEGTDMGYALDQVKDAVALLRNLPSDSEEPEIIRIIRYDPIASLLVAGTDDPAELRHLVRQIERELLDRGIAKIEFIGLPEEEVAIQIPTARLEELGISFSGIASQIVNFSRDIPAGAIGRYDATRQLRSVEQRRDVLQFFSLPIVANESGRLLTLGDVASSIVRRPKEGEVRVEYHGKPAVELRLQRAETSDALAGAEILRKWLAESRASLPAHVVLKTYDEAWELIDQRISLLINNGLSGLLLVLVTLFLFLNARVAFWVAMGVPTSLMAMLAILYFVGGSINMISLFAMIMALGIIVDDAIVVGEDAFTHYQRGENPLLAAEGGAVRMLAPVFSSSLTTVAAFFPLMFISGTIGNILFDIPLVMICVLIASLIECFLVLPGHLRGTFHHIHDQKPHKMRAWLENAFDAFRDRFFRPIVTVCVDAPLVTVSCLIAVILFAAGLMAGGRVAFNFFPTPDGTIFMANVSFVAGTPSEVVSEFLTHLDETLTRTNEELGGHLLKVAVMRHGVTTTADGRGLRGDQFGSMMVELIDPDKRTVRNRDFLKQWRDKVKMPAGMETLTITERRGGPPGRDLEIQFTGSDTQSVKAAVLQVAEALRTYEGVSAITDDMPFGREQWIYELTPQGQALGLTVESVGRQLRAAFDGQLVQIFQDGDDEVEVRLSLPDAERYRLASLDKFVLQLPNGKTVPFYTAVKITPRRGFEALRHAQGRLAAQVSADVDATVTTNNKVLSDLQESLLPELAKQYRVSYSFEGRAADQAETLGDMRSGSILGIALIYIILAWQFGSYGWPLIVMIVIPFGLVGAIVGHWIIGINLTILSLFGFFGLSGIVVNDSIVLVSFYQELRAGGMAIREALIEAACQRLRAVLLTSLTTIFGLLPLLLEKSLQAQFLIPMAVSISFGLMFSTLMVLLVIPALLGFYENWFAPTYVPDADADVAES